MGRTDGRFISIGKSEPPYMEEWSLEALMAKRIEKLEAHVKYLEELIKNSTICPVTLPESWQDWDKDNA